MIANGFFFRRREARLYVSQDGGRNIFAQVPGKNGCSGMRLKMMLAGRGQ